MAWGGLNDAGRSTAIQYIVKITICLACVLVRLWCKLARAGEIRRYFGWDDFWIVAALSLTITESALAIWGTVESKGGLPAPVLIAGGNLEAAQNFLKAMYFGNTFWHLAEACICASILCFYLKIFEHQTGFRRQVYCLFAYTAVWGLAAGLGEILLCVPPSNFWNMKDLDKCGSFNNYLLGTAVTEIVLVSLIFVLPIRPVLGLRMDLKKKLSVLGIFLLGSFTIVSAIVRIALIYSPTAPAPNYYFYILWSNIHTSAAYVCSTLPLCRPIWHKLAWPSTKIWSYSRTLFGRMSAHTNDSQGIPLSHRSKIDKGNETETGEGTLLDTAGQLGTEESKVSGESRSSREDEIWTRDKAHV